jgi:hypothetical protein
VKSDRRFQIFISSTFKDLREQRKQAVEVIFERGHIPIALERFSPANESDLETIKSVIAECQIYLLILGHRYGDIVPGRDISFTELEYEIAEENGLLILPFVLKPDEITKRRQALNPDIEKDKAELSNFDRLLKFHNRIQRFRKLWGPDDQFKYLIATAISDNLNKCKKPAFVREPEEPTIALLASASQNEFIVDIVEQLKNFKKLYVRCSQESDKKRELARYFREQYLDGIINDKVNLFFESGSTVAYVAKELVEPFSRVIKIKEKGKPNIGISTNNVLAYLLFWLTARVPCTTFPWSPPNEETYGALYGGLEKIEDNRPLYDLSPLNEEAKKEIKRLLETPFSLSSMERPALLLGATSGLQLSKDPDLSFKDGLNESSQTELKSQLDNCLGPHVGSYRNKIFKRFMYETGIPIMIFITDDKIDSKIEVGKCHFVLDSEFTWEDFHTKHPVGFCVGCSQDNKDAYIALFEKLNYKILKGYNFSKITAFIARNDKFIDEFEE